MSKSTSCFPSLKCLGKRKNSSFLKIKTQINMPTMREFLYRNNNAGTQTTVCYSEKVNSNESLQLRPRLQNPGSYRSTIAILHNRNFVPLSNSESDKKLSISKFQSPDISILPSHPQRLPNNSTVLMSRGSFDAFFANSQAEKKESEKKYFESKTVERKRNPFVLENRRMPKIIPITPSNRKRSASRQKISFESKKSFQCFDSSESNFNSQKTEDFLIESEFNFS